VPIAEVDLKAGESVVSTIRILEANDPILDPKNRPSLESAIEMILGWQNGLQVPFAAVPLAHHAGIAEQNLFRCLFGRDSLLITELLQKRRPELRENVVVALAAFQGAVYDDLSEEEPGRIPHEVREPDDPRARELIESGGWKFPYYGSVDATLIWLRTLATIAVSSPVILEREVSGLPLWKRALAATHWIMTRLETSSGLIESNRKNSRGIQNQVWKDSGDSYMHADGTLAIGDSTASVETVAETYDALMAAAKIQQLYSTGEWAYSPRELISKAEALRAKLFDLMWLGDRFALGTERDSNGVQRPFDSQASNQGRLLDSGILLGREFSQYRSAIAEAVTDPTLLGETGLRTLSKSHVSYRPGGYHTGSAWPMDGVFTARGLASHGFVRESTLIATKIKGAIESIGGYPEFFRGDSPDHGLITMCVANVILENSRGERSVNRIVQPPQIMQGWTIGAYAWISDHQS